MEQISVRPDAGLVEKIQSFVSRLEIGDTFRPRDLDPDIHPRDWPYTVTQMNCVAHVTTGIYQKTADPRTLPTHYPNSRLRSVPLVCVDCHFKQSGTVGCIIFDATQERDGGTVSDSE